MTEASAPTIERAYRVRLRPTRAQARTLRRLMGAKRFAWNWALAESNASYKDTGKRKSLADLSAAFTALRKAEDTEWLATLPREPFNQVLRDLERSRSSSDAARSMRCASPSTNAVNRSIESTGACRSTGSARCASRSPSRCSAGFVP
jgi:hypothetical protein